MKIRGKSPRILLSLGWYDHRLHRGIERYAQEQGWQLSEDLAREKVIPWGWDGDGILAWLGAGDDVADFIVHARKPTVDFSLRRPQLKFMRVLEDTAEAARLVADHFLSLGLSHFGFYSDVGNWVYNERGKGFQAALARSGRDLKWLRWHESNAHRTDRLAWQFKRAWLAAEIKRTEKPVGVFAASDELALEVLEACEETGLNVPEHVAIVGAGNSLLAVDAMSTPISSVDTNLEALGYQGARELDRLMHRRVVPTTPLRVPPFRLVVRKSSDLTAVNHPAIARSLRFLCEHYREQIGVNDLARIASMSTRRFHQAFTRHVGRAPGTEIHRVRIECGKKLLRDSDERMARIAEQCGFRCSNAFWIAFKHATGMSPKQYRNQGIASTWRAFPVKSKSKRI